MENKSKILTSVAIIGSFLASICCIGPFIALAITGSSFASLFSWLTPFRPILIGLTVMILIYAWQRKLRRPRQSDCDCGSQRKLRFIDTKLFLGILTAVAILFMSFPYYSSLSASRRSPELQSLNKTNQTIVKFQVAGMTCESCAKSIKTSLEAKAGVQDVTVLLSENTVLVAFDQKNMTSKQISEYFEGMGYSVLSATEGKQ